MTTRTIDSAKDNPVANFKEQTWKAGDLFAIGLADGASAIGQVLSYEPKAMNSASICLFSTRNSLYPTREDVFGKMLTTRDLLDNGIWKIVGHLDVVLPRDQFPFESTRANKFIGAKIVGSRHVTAFANAFFGCGPWNLYKDPEYFDKLLTVPRPMNVVFIERD